MSDAYTKPDELDLDAIEMYVDAAARGPWELRDALEGDGFPGHRWVVAADDEGPDEEQIVISVGRKEDGEFIAAARSDLPALAAVVVTVRRLHGKPRTDRYGSGCIHCGIFWPCPTYRAVTGMPNPGIKS